VKKTLKKIKSDYTSIIKKLQEQQDLSLFKVKALGAL